MVKVVRSTVLDHPAEAVWAVVRDFNGHEWWHPAIADSEIERRRTADEVGCVRRFHLPDGGELRERLLTLSDADMAYSYCLMETPVPLLNYVSHVRVLPVTDGDRAAWFWESRFDVPAGQEKALAELVGEGIYRAGFDAVRAHMDAGGGAEPPLRGAA